MKFVLAIFISFSTLYSSNQQYGGPEYTDSLWCSLCACNWKDFNYYGCYEPVKIDSWIPKDSDKAYWLKGLKHEASGDFITDSTPSFYQHKIFRDSIKPYVADPMDSSYRIIPLSLSIIIDPPNYARTFEIAVMSLLWKEYKDSCWADSSKHMMDIYNSRDGVTFYSEHNPKSIDEGFNSEFMGHKEIYLHKEATFEGFMDFLDRKRQRGK